MRILTVALCLLATSAHAATIPEYDAVRTARPDGRTIPVQGLTLVRDAFRIELRSGTLHLLAPIGDATFGAVFVGDGSYHLTPATAHERRHLRLVTGNTQLETLTDRFDRMVLLFTDRTAAELLDHARVVTGVPNDQAVRWYDDYLKRQQKDLGINLHLRIATDLINRPGRSDGLFLMPVEGKTYGKVLLAFEPLGLSNLSAQFGNLGGEEAMLLSADTKKGGFWYLSAPVKDAVGGRGKAVRPWADALSYKIDTTIEGTQIKGRTRITLAPLVEGVRLLPINIDSSLTLRSAALVSEAGSVPLPIVRDELTLGQYERLWSASVGDGDIAVAFPRVLPKGEQVSVLFEYDGDDVLDGAGGRYAVRARSSWYPNLGTFVDVADYELTFRYPRRNTLIGVGRQVNELIDGNLKVSTWKSDLPLRVAGFNYGEFEKLTSTDPDTGMGINVYTNRDWTSQARVALADATNSSRVASNFFGKSPFSQVSITQQVQTNFGQSWPTLVFLPTLALTDSRQRAMDLDVDPRSSGALNEFVNTVNWHEVAHQWWGHQIGWQTYRDQWLSEGFAEFTSALTLEVFQGRRSYDRYWLLRRTEILEKRKDVANSEAGAITQGFRLATERSPSAARFILYSKGAYVLHMLRMMMRDDARGNDADRPFKAMMTEFVRTWQGKSPSTDDFQRMVEKHITPALNVTRDGRMDWFFNQWVHGTEIPTLTSALQAEDIGGGKYRITGTLTQAGVSETFRTLVPVYLDFGDDRVQKLGMMQLVGAATQKVSVEVALPLKPRRVLINARNDVLTR
jgi:hypothetical protein